MAEAVINTSWLRRSAQRLRHSLRARMVAVFIVLALAMTAIFLAGMQRALTVGWRDAARPLLADYVDRVVDEIGSPPSQTRAEALAARLPLRIRISGPQVNWQSAADDEDEVAYWGRRSGRHFPDGGFLGRTTADGHRIELGLDTRAWRDRPRLVGWVTLAVLLALTAAAYAYVRGQLRPLEDIRAGARRFGEGRFGDPIPVRRRDELGDLAQDVNAMASSIHGMLEAKRALLLAISHELRSPLTRARLNGELLPEGGEAGLRRAALLADLQEMADLVTDLLESERLAQGHAALHREQVEFGALVREVIENLQAARPAASTIRVAVRGGSIVAFVDRSRLRLLLRNLLDNALRHSPSGGPAPEVRIEGEGGLLRIVVRDHGSGVDPAVLPHLAEPFFRADEARTRVTGGVGLGLHLCRLVAQAHGGRIAFANADPGLDVQVELPAGLPLDG